MSRTINSLKTENDGFTLVETLVALLIFALAAIALSATQSVGIKTQIAIEDQAYAEILAHNIAVLNAAKRAPQPRGFKSGSDEIGGRTYNWRTNRLETGSPRLNRLDVSVSNADTGQTLHTVSLLVSDGDIP